MAKILRVTADPLVLSRTASGMRILVLMRRMVLRVMPIVRSGTPALRRALAFAEVILLRSLRVTDSGQ